MRWAIRFVVAAALYIVTTTFWINNAQGWASLGLFVATLAFGVMALIAWCAAITLGHFLVRHEWARPIAHPILTTMLFAILALAVLSGFFGDTYEAAWRETMPFVVLVGLCALADAAVGFLFERAAPMRPAGAP